VIGESSDAVPRPFRQRAVEAILGPAPTSRRRSRFDRIDSPSIDSSAPEAVAGLVVAVALLLVMVWASWHWQNPLLRFGAIVLSVLGVLIVIRAVIVVRRVLSGRQ